VPAFAGTTGLDSRLWMFSENVLAASSPATRISSLHAHVLAEIVIPAAVALEVPARALGIVTAGKDLGQKTLLRRPAGVGFRLAVAARHGVVEPAMRRAFVNVDVVALVVGLEAIAESLYIRERDDVIGLAERSEYRAGNRRDHLLKRPRVELVDLPFALGGG